MKNGRKVCFLMQRFLSNSQVSSSLTAIIAPRGLRINGERLKPPHHWKAYFCTILSKQRAQVIKIDNDQCLTQS